MHDLRNKNYILSHWSNAVLENQKYVTISASLLDTESPNSAVGIETS
jgi:hypothetical protein